MLFSTIGVYSCLLHYSQYKFKLQYFMGSYQIHEANNQYMFAVLDINTGTFDQSTFPDVLI